MKIGQRDPNDEKVKVKYLLPSPKMAHTILRDNFNQTRILQTTKHQLENQARKELLFVDRIKNRFISSQDRKKGKWKREDEIRVNCLNLPTIQTQVHNRPMSMKVIYSSPNYQSADSKKIFVPLRKHMDVQRQKMEIVSHHAQLAVTHVTPMVSLSDTTLRRYDRYRGTSFLTPSFLKSSGEFQKCETMLSQLQASLSKASDPAKGKTGFYLSCPAKHAYSSEEARQQLYSKMSSERGLWTTRP